MKSSSHIEDISPGPCLVCMFLTCQMNEWDDEPEDVDIDLPHDGRGLVRWEDGTPGPDVYLEQVCSSVIE